MTRGLTIPWREIFTRWLRARPYLDRIEFVDVATFPGQAYAFEYTGPIIIVAQDRG